MLAEAIVSDVLRAPRLADRIAAADPAYSRLRLASRAMLTLGLSGGVLAGITLVHAMPIATYGIAVVLSFISSLAVRDKTAREQIVTRLHAGWAASGAVFLASVLAPHPVTADIGFLCVIFGSVYIRRFGPRWFAVGMVAFLGYFIGDFLKALPQQIGWIVLAAAIALTTSHLVSSLLFPDDPEHDFRRAVRTIDHRINLILHNLLGLADRQAGQGSDVEPLREHLASLQSMVLMAEGFIPQGKRGALSLQGAAAELATALFDLQLAVERLVRSRHTCLPDPAMLRALLDENGSLLRQGPQVEATAESDAACEIAAHLLLRLRNARVRINDVLGTPPSAAFEEAEAAAAGDDNGLAAAGEGAEGAPADGDQNNGSPPWYSVPEPLQRPIQVTLACALALGAGWPISPDRWYWAVITAFIVFNNTRSRADTAIRALQRSAGTLGGLFAGTAVATLLHGHFMASGLTIAILFFAAFYFLQTSYGLMIFFITIAIALLYGLMGMFSPELLLVRLEETVVGGLAGALVAFTVFPVSTSTGVQGAIEGYMEALKDLVAAAQRAAHQEGKSGELLALSRVVDRRHGELATAVHPLSAPWNTVTRYGHVRRGLLPFIGVAHWGRVLAQTLVAQAPLHTAALMDFDALVREIEKEIVEARERGTDIFAPRGIRQPDPVTGAASSPLPSLGQEDAIQALDAIRDLMKQLCGPADVPGAGAR